MTKQTFHALRRGDLVPPYAVTATAEDVRDYLEATGEAPERWVQTVPPLAIGALLLAGLMEQIPLPDGAVHVGQQFEFLRPVAHGEPVEARLTIAQQGIRAGQNMVVFAAEVVATDGSLVMRGRSMVFAPALTQEGAG